MYREDNDKLWMAYLDGQMSASEALSFEATLAPEERDRLAQEMRMERGLADALAEAPPCPPALWECSVAAFGGAAPKAAAPLFARKRVFLGLAAGLAAVLVFVLYPQQAYQRQSEPDEPILTISESCTNAFALRSSTEGSLLAVQAFLDQRGVDLSFIGLPAELDTQHHHLRLLGASERGCHGNPAMEIMFACCDKPVKVVLARKGSRPAIILQNARGTKSVQQVEDMGKFIGAVIATHRTPDLLRLFEQQQEQPDIVANYL